MTIEAKYVELMNADLDGEISDAERIDLAKFLEANPEAAAMRAKLGELCGALDEMGQMDPPPHLKYAILDSLKKSGGSSRGRVKSGGLGLRQLFAMPALRHAFTFGAGAFLTFALISSDRISDQAFDDVTGLVGTISDSAPDATGQNTIRLTSNEIAGMVSTHVAGSLNVVDFNLAAEGPVEIIAEFSGHELWFKGFAQLESDDTRIIADEGMVRMHIQGRNRYALYLQHTNDIDTTVTFKFYSAGNLIHEDSLIIGNEHKKAE
jgi:hypothetical protein